MYKYSIEIGHLLAKDAVGNSQKQALLIKQDLKLSGYNCLMIDNYNFIEQNYDLKDLALIYEEQKENLPIIIYESQLVELASKLLNKIPRNLIRFNELGLATLLVGDNQKVDLVTTDGYSCAFLTAVWYLARLNRLDWDMPKVEGLVNILPEQFSASEKKVQKILNALYPQELNLITWYFY